MHTVNLEPFVYGGTNITGIRLIDPEDPVVRETVKYMRTKEASARNKEQFINFNETTMTVSNI